MPEAQISPSRARALAVVLALVALAPFIQSLTFGYVLDDTYAIRGNESLRGWTSLGRVWLEQFGGDAGPFFGLYRPLTMTLFALVFNAGAKWPLWFHLVALLLHAGATICVWRLLRLSVAWWPAFLAALWFAVHPVHVEAVANITNTSEVLVAIWTVLLMLFLVSRARSESAISWGSAAVGGALYVAAMLSKESGAMAAPVALLAAWGWQRHLAPTPQWMLERWWRLGIAFAAAVVLVALMRAAVLGGPITGQPIAALGIAGMSTPERVVAMTSLVAKIAMLLAWPPGVNPHYGPSTFPEHRAAFAAIGLLIVVAVFALGGGLAHRGDRRVLAATGIAVVSFLPASNLLVPTGQVLAERTLYLPSVGVALAIGVILEWLSRRDVSPAFLRIATSVFVLVLLWSAARAARWTEHWRNHERLFARMIAADPRGYAGYWLSGVEATLQKRPNEGLEFFEKAYAIEQRDRGLVLDYGASLTNHGQYQRAASVYRDALRLAPHDSALVARLRALPRH